MIACLGQLHGCATNEALLVALLVRSLLELLIVFVLVALVILGSLVEQRPALDTGQLPALFGFANGVCDFRFGVFNVGSGG